MVDIDGFKKCMEDYLENYNDEKTPMNLILFLDACEHVSKICRVLRQPKAICYWWELEEVEDNL